MQPETTSEDVPMYCIANKGDGFTNQMFRLVHAILSIHLQHRPALSVSSMSTDWMKNERIPLSAILDIESYQQYVQEHYQVRLSLADHDREDAIQEFGWVHDLHGPKFRDLLTHLPFRRTPRIQKYMDEYGSLYPNIHAIHLRLEEDGVACWSHAIHPEEQERYRQRLVDRYRSLIQKYITTPMESTLILCLCHHPENEITEYLRQDSGFSVLTLEKTGDRELDALHDFMVTTGLCNGVFIGNYYPPSRQWGSSYSYLIATRLGPEVCKIMIDLHQLEAPEYVSSRIE